MKTKQFLMPLNSVSTAFKYKLLADIKSILVCACFLFCLEFNTTEESR